MQFWYAVNPQKIAVMGHPKNVGLGSSRLMLLHIIMGGKTSKNLCTNGNHLRLKGWQLSSQFYSSNQWERADLTCRLLCTSVLTWLGIPEELTCCLFLTSFRTQVGKAAGFAPKSSQRLHAHRHPGQQILTGVIQQTTEGLEEKVG